MILSKNGISCCLNKKVFNWIVERVQFGHFDFDEFVPVVMCM